MTSTADMRVICRQKGYLFANSFPTAIYGQSDTKASIYQLNCIGNESFINECSYNVVTNQGGCTHVRDLSLACSGMSPICI